MEARSPEELGPDVRSKRQDCERASLDLMCRQRGGKVCTLTLRWFWCSCVRCQKHVTVGAKRFRCAAVSFQPKNYELPGRKHHHCWRQTLPLSGSAVPAHRPTSSHGKVIAVCAKRFRYAEVLFMPITHELPYGIIFTVGPSLF